MISIHASERVSCTMGQGGVATVRLNRTDKLNALDQAMVDGQIAAAQALGDAPGLRAVVIHGAGRAFCAGLDLSEMTRLAAGGEDLMLRTHGVSNRYQALAMLWRGLPVPVIAAIHGICFGGGLQIAAGADIRIAAPDTRLSVMETKWGLIPDMGHYVVWRGVVRDDVLRELTYTAREFSGEDAAALGLVTRTAADPLASALALARDIAERSPDAVRAAKALAEQALDADPAEMLLAESAAQAILIGGPNQREAVASGLQNRPPRFIDP